jgi:hypothetical protein
MATAEIVNADPFCDVELQPLAETLGKQTQIRLKDDEGNWIPIGTKGAIHGSDYALVPNSRVQQMVGDVLTRTNLEFKPLPSEYNNSKASNVSWDGKKFATRWYLEDVNGDITDDGTQSKLMLGVEGVNSYDGSYKVGVQFYMMSMTCQNQFYSNNLLGGFTFGHYDRGTSSLDEDLVNATQLIQEQATRFERALPKLQSMIDTPLHATDTFQGYLDIREGLMGKGKAWASSHEPHVLNEINNTGITADMGVTQTAHARNLWGLLNAYTAVATHHSGGFNGSRLSQCATDHLILAAA